MSDVTPNPQELDADIAAIRNILGESFDSAPEPKGARRRAAFAPLADADEDGTPQTTANKPMPVAEPELAAAVAQTVKAAKTGKAPKKPKKPRAPRTPILTRLPFVAQGLAKLRGYRPTRKHIILASLALILILRPLWLVLPVVLGFFAVLGCFVIFGADEVWDRVVRFLKWYSGKRPEKGREMVRKLDSFALKWDAVLDRFPEGLVEAFYMPDLNAALDRDAIHTKAVEARLTALKQG